MDLNWKLNKTEHIVQDEWIDFRKESFILPDGKEFSPFYNYSRRNFVVIIAKTKDGKYITVRQFRHGHPSLVYYTEKRRGLENITSPLFVLLLNKEVV